MALLDAHLLAARVGVGPRLVLRRRPPRDHLDDDAAELLHQPHLHIHTHTHTYTHTHIGEVRMIDICAAELLHPPHLLDLELGARVLGVLHEHREQVSI